MVNLGAGRKVAGEVINLDVSLQFFAYPNQAFKKGDIIAKIYHTDPSMFAKCDTEAKFLSSIEFTNSSDFLDTTPFVYELI